MSDYRGLPKSSKYLCLSGCPASLLRMSNKDNFGFTPIIQENIRISSQQQEEVYKLYMSGECLLGTESLILIGCTNIASGQKMAANIAIKYIEDSLNPLPFVKWIHLGYKDWSYFQDTNTKRGIVIIPEIDKTVDLDRISTAKDYINASSGATVIVVAQLMTDQRNNLIGDDNTLKLANRLGLHPDVVIQLGNPTKKVTRI